MKIATLASLLFTSCLFSQTIQLIDTSDYKTRTEVIEKLESHYNSINSEIKQSYKGKMRREMEFIYESSQAEFLESINHKKLIFNSPFNKYMDSVGSQIKEKNITLKDTDLVFFVAKDPLPNAFCMGDNTFVINIGLFSFFDNEYELLSVISHEFAHQILKHGKKNIKRKAEANINILDRRSLTVRNISKNKYNRGSQSFAILKNLLYEQGEIKRQQEIQADSLGYIIFKSLNGQKSEFINSLKKLVDIDSVPTEEVSKSVYKTVFDLPNLPFEESWFKSENFDDYNYNFYTEKITQDSISSHPEAIDRINHLQQIFPELKETFEAEKASKTYLKLKELAKKTRVENLYYLNEYGLSIYLILYRLHQGIDVDYCKAWLGINFEALFEAKKKYQLNRYVDRVVPNEQSKSYQQFLNFIWNLKLNEIKTIAEHYSKTFSD